MRELPRRQGSPRDIRAREPLAGGHAVVVAGGGPTGMMLAGELALAGVDVAIVERGAGDRRAAARAGGLQARTLELLDQRGIVDRFLAEGQVAQVAGFGGIRLDISDLSTRHPYGLALWQEHVERLLAEWISGLGVTVHHGHEVTGFVQDADGVDVLLAAGIAFPGWDASTSQLIGEVEMTAQPPMGIHRKPGGCMPSAGWSTASATMAGSNTPKAARCG